jgi:hypothetical protein
MIVYLLLLTVIINIYYYYYYSYWEKKKTLSKLVLPVPTFDICAWDLDSKP